MSKKSLLGVMTNCIFDVKSIVNDKISIFFNSGKHDVINILDYLKKLNYNTDNLKEYNCIDFGCGVGKMARHIK